MTEKSRFELEWTDVEYARVAESGSFNAEYEVYDNRTVSQVDLRFDWPKHDAERVIQMIFLLLAGQTVGDR